MEKTIESYYYNKETGIPVKKSMFVIFLNFVLLMIYKIVKSTLSLINRVFPAGVDNKKRIKE